MEEKDSEISGPCEEFRIWFCGEVPSGSVAWYCIDVSETTESSTKKLNPFSVSNHFPSDYYAFLEGCIYSLGGQGSDETLLNDVWILDIKSLDGFAARGEEKPKEPEKPQEWLLACGEAQMAAKPYGPDSVPYCKPQEPEKAWPFGKPRPLLAQDPDEERLLAAHLEGLRLYAEQQERLKETMPRLAQQERLKQLRLLPQESEKERPRKSFSKVSAWRSSIKPGVKVVKHFREHWEEEGWKPGCISPPTFTKEGKDWKPDSGSGETWKPNYVVPPWIRGPQMTFARCNPHTMVVDQKLYVLGGFEPNQSQAAGWIEVFDPVVGEWEVLPSPPDQIHSSVMISGLLKAKGEIIIAKQRRDRHPMLFYSYNILTRCWNTLVPHESNVIVHLPPNAGRAVTVGNTLYWISTEEHNHECIIRAYDLDRNMWFKDNLNTATIFGRGEHISSIYSSRPGFLHLRDQKFCLLLQSSITRDYPESSIKYLYCVTLDISPIYEHEYRGKFELTNVSFQKYSMDQYFDFLDCMLEEISEDTANCHSYKKKYSILVSLSGHLFDQFLINEALDIIEAAGGSFHSVKCQVGQSADVKSYSELEVSADDRVVLDQIIDSLTFLANPNETSGNQEKNKMSLKVGKVQESDIKKGHDTERKTSVLILGAGRVCQLAAELLASSGRFSSHQGYKACLEDDSEEQNDVQVIVGSLYLKDAEEIIEGIPNATAIQLDVMDHENLFKYVSQVEVVISLLPASCHIIVANACIELKKHLVTASYVDESMSMLNEKAKSAGVTILGEMGLDPGIDHMMAMKMINEAHVRKGIIRSFTSYCGGLPSPAAANNPLAYKFSWSPAGAIRAGKNPATYRSCGETLHIDGDSLYDSAVRLRIPDLPAFALECLPNRNSLVYGELYGIGHEASTIFRGTLRYEGFGEIMATLARIGFFDTEAHPILKDGKKPTFRTFLLELLKSKDVDGPLIAEKDIAERIVTLGHCKEQGTAVKAAKTIIFLGFHKDGEIPASCQSAFDVTCLCMEEHLAYSSTDQDMVLLHHEVEVDFPDGLSENHGATLLEFGRTKNGKMTTAMALTVGIPAGIGALLLLENKIKSRGVLRPIEPEIYEPALDRLEAYGFKLMDKIQ